MVLIHYKSPPTFKYICLYIAVQNYSFYDFEFLVFDNLMVMEVEWIKKDFKYNSMLFLLSVLYQMNFDISKNLILLALHFVFVQKPEC